MEEEYITEFTNKSGKKYGWSVWANSYEEAQTLVDERGIGESVLGRIPHDCKDCRWTGILKE